MAVEKKDVEKMFAAPVVKKSYNIAIIEGDGIGKEVVPQGVICLQRCSQLFGVEFKFTKFDWGCDYYAKNKKMMPDDGIEQLKKFDAIYLGAVGWPTVPDHISLWGLLLPIRQKLGQFVNYRPARAFPGIKCPLAGRGPADLDMVCIRENCEGEYVACGGRHYSGTPHEMCVQDTIMTRYGVDRIVRYAFECAKRRPKKHLTSATKSNAMMYSMVFWDERVAEIAKEYPDVKVDKYHVDNLCCQFVLHPDKFDVVVASNLFGDILTDLAPACCGTLGIAPSANLNPTREMPSMFEPVHGSAPDIAGKWIANPIAAIWAAATMAEFLGLNDISNAILKGIEKVILDGKVLTKDMGGNAGTKEVGEAVRDAIAK